MKYYKDLFTQKNAQQGQLCQNMTSFDHSGLKIRMGNCSLQQRRGTMRSQSRTGLPWAVGTVGASRENCQWFQQDRATPNTANVTLDWLDQRFSQRLVNRRRDPERSPHSLDLDPPDFFVWGYLRNRVYDNNPKTILELKQAISQNIRVTIKQECIRVIYNFSHCLQVCLQQKEGQLLQIQ